MGGVEPTGPDIDRLVSSDEGVHSFASPVGSQSNSRPGSVVSSNRSFGANPCDPQRQRSESSMAAALRVVRPDPEAVLSPVFGGHNRLTALPERSGTPQSDPTRLNTASPSPDRSPGEALAQFMREKSAHLPRTPARDSPRLPALGPRATMLRVPSDLELLTAGRPATSPALTPQVALRAPLTPRKDLHLNPLTGNHRSSSSHNLRANAISPAVKSPRSPHPPTLLPRPLHVAPLDRMSSPRLPIPLQSEPADMETISSLVAASEGGSFGTNSGLSFVAPDRPKRNRGPTLAETPQTNHSVFSRMALFPDTESFNSLEDMATPSLPTPNTSKARRILERPGFLADLESCPSPSSSDCSPSSSFELSPARHSHVEFSEGPCSPTVAPLEMCHSAPVPSFHRRRPQSLSRIILGDSSTTASQPDDPMAAHEIIPNLFLGPQSFAHNYALLKAARISHILIVARNARPPFPSDFEYCVSEDLEDHPDQEILSLFRRFFPFLDRGREDPNRVLVHCNAGVSRSPSVVIGYVMKLFGYGFQQALDFVRAKRAVIFPNVGFTQQLRAFDKMRCEVDGSTDQHLLHAIKFTRSMETFDLAPWRHLHTLLFPDEPALTDARIAALLRLPHLTSLDLSNTQVSDTGLAALAPHSQLHVLHLRGTAATDASLVTLNPACPFTTLSVPPHASNICAKFLAANFALTLTDVDLAFSDIDDEGVAEMWAKCPSLRTLTLAHMPHLTPRAAAAVPPDVTVTTDETYPHHATWQKLKGPPASPVLLVAHGNPFRQKAPKKPPERGAVSGP